MSENTRYLYKSTPCACIVCEKVFSPLAGPWTCGRCHTKYQQGRPGRGRPRSSCAKCYAVRQLKPRKFCSTKCGSRYHSRKAHKRNPLKYWARDLKKKYDITPQDYTEMLAEQDGNCGICGAPPGDSRLCVDHNHRTGMVRGLLCFSCNVGIGNLRHDPWKLRAAADYLERHGLRPPQPKTRQSRSGR